MDVPVAASFYVSIYIAALGSQDRSGKENKENTG